MKLKKVITIFSASIFMLCCACGTGNGSTAKSKEVKDMSMADTPEIISCRAIDAIASMDKEAYDACYHDQSSILEQSYEEVYEKYALQCREFEVDYNTKRSYKDFNLYLFNDRRDTDGFVSFEAFLGDSELIGFHIKTQYDISSDKYYIEEIIPGTAGKGGTPQSMIQGNYPQVDLENIEID